MLPLTHAAPGLAGAGCGMGVKGWGSLAGSRRASAIWWPGPARASAPRRPLAGSQSQTPPSWPEIRRLLAHALGEQLTCLWESGLWTREKGNLPWVLAYRFS